MALRDSTNYQVSSRFHKQYSTSFGQNFFKIAITYDEYSRQYSLPLETHVGIKEFCDMQKNVPISHSTILKMSIYPWNCESVILNDQKDFQTVIKLKNIEIGDYPRLHHWNQSNHMIS